MPKIILPSFHPAQEKFFWLPGRNKVMRCGRRFGKTAFMNTMAADALIKGRICGWFTPDYKIQQEAWRDIADLLDPIIKSANKSEKEIHTTTGGRLDFWTLENERAGRSRKYHLALLDEIAFAKNNVRHIWETAIAPTLLDYSGRAIAASTPAGDDPENFFWQLCNDPELGFKEFHAPTADNPFLPRSEIEALKKKYPPLVYAQEYEALFVNWSGEAFFDLRTLLVDGEPIDPPNHIAYTFATIDTTRKGGVGNDGTAVIYWAYQDLKMTGQYELTILDWDIVELQGYLLENWLPQVFERLTRYATELKARHGTLGAFIEDAAVGTTLLQQGKSRGWPVHAIDSKMTSIGKDARAVNASGYTYPGRVKFSKHAYLLTRPYKGVTRNHLVAQIKDFRPDDPDPKRQDDLADAFFYGPALALGNSAGF